MTYSYEKPMKLTIECVCGTKACFEGEKENVLKEYAKFMEGHIDHLTLSDEDKRLLREEYADPGCFTSVRKFLSNKILKECFYISPKEPNDE